jgi:hypothetical protein
MNRIEPYNTINFKKLRYHWTRDPRKTTPNSANLTHEQLEQMYTPQELEQLATNPTHPNHITFDWYEEQKRTRTPIDIARELDIDYENAQASRVYLDLAPSERSEAEPNLVSGANSYLISFDF